MGYRVDRTAILELADMDGAEVTVTIGVPLRGLKEWFECETREAEWAAFVKWAKPVWDLEDADGAIPAEGSEEIYLRLPPAVRVAIQKAWRDAVVNPPVPLPQPSENTEP